MIMDSVIFLCCALSRTERGRTRYYDGDELDKEHEGLHQ